MRTHHRPPPHARETGLRGVAGVAVVCHNSLTASILPRPDGSTPDVAEELCPGSVFLLQASPSSTTSADAHRPPLPAQPPWRHEYGGRMVLPADASGLQARFGNWV